MSIRGVSEFEFNSYNSHHARPEVLGAIDPETGIQDGSFEAGLHLLSQVARPGQTFSYAEIGWACARFASDCVGK